MNMWRRKEILRLLFVLFLGQVVSFNLAITSFTTSLLANLGVDTPLSQSFFTYLSLALVYCPILIYRGQRLMVPWYWYALLGLIDVLGNYFVIKAFQFSSITSVTLLDCWTIPWVMILTWIFIGTRYSLSQFLGAAVCIVGLGLVLLSDVKDTGSGGKKPLLGDVLVIGGTLCYAMSNVGEEFCVKKRDRVEVISMLGVFGLVVSICAISVTERKDIAEVKWSSEIILAFVGFTLSTFMFYSIVPFVLKDLYMVSLLNWGAFLPERDKPTYRIPGLDNSLTGVFDIQMSGAALFNLSLLTSDMWAVVIRIFFYHQKVDWLYYLSFVIVALGLIIYAITDKDPVIAIDIKDGDNSIQYQALNQENAVSINEVGAT